MFLAESLFLPDTVWEKCRFLLLFVFGCIFLPTIRNVPRQVFGNAGAV